MRGNASERDERATGTALQERPAPQSAGPAGNGRNPWRIAQFVLAAGSAIPLLFWDFEKTFKKGDNLVLATFGGGFTWGSIYLRWAYNS